MFVNLNYKTYRVPVPFRSMGGHNLKKKGKTSIFNFMISKIKNYNQCTTIEPTFISLLLIRKKNQTLLSTFSKGDIERIRLRCYHGLKHGEDNEGQENESSI